MNYYEAYLKLITLYQREPTLLEWLKDTEFSLTYYYEAQKIFRESD